MINVTLISKSNQIIGFEISGHAGFAEYGQDIICSAVSVLAINTINSVEAFTKDRFDFTIRENDGFLYFKLISDVSEQSQLLLNSFKLGIISIKQQYGNNYIDIIIKEV